MSTPSFYNLKNKKLDMVSVKKLKRFLNYLEIPYQEFNNRIKYTKKGQIISINNPKFPFNLNCKEGSLLLGAIVSDGCMYLDKKASGTIRTKYSTSEEESINDFIKWINSIFGDVHFNKEVVRNCIVIRIGSSLIGNSLLKVGGILGHKAKQDLGSPWFIKYGSEILKSNYIKAAFSDEASLYIGKRTCDSYIIFTRYKHIQGLSNSQLFALGKLDKYMDETRFKTGHITKTISIKKALAILSNKYNLDKILVIPPNLLKDESDILNKFGIEHRIWPRNLNKTHLGNYSLGFDIIINKNKSITQFYKKAGFILSKKQEKLKKIISNLSK